MRIKSTFEAVRHIFTIFFIIFISLIFFFVDVSKIEVPIFNIVPPKKEIILYPSVHEQDDGVIFALCATGTSSKDSLLSWIRHLEKDDNPSLGSIPVVFTLKTGEKELTVATDDTNKKIDDH